MCPSGCDFTNVQDAVNAADDGDTISIGTGTYTGTVVVPYNLTFVGTGVGSTILDGNHVGNVITVYTGVSLTISGLTIQNGSGYGISSTGAVTLNGVIVSANNSGGIYSASPGSLTLSGSTVSDNNVVGSGGAGIYTCGTTLLTNSAVVSNTLTGQNGGSVVGGGIYNCGALTVTNSTVISNSALGGGESFGGGYAFGGGIYSTGTLTVTTSQVTQNMAIGGSSNYCCYADGRGEGGGLYTSGTSATITDSSVSGNSVTAGSNSYQPMAAGGGVYNATTLTISGTTVSTNTVSVLNAASSTGGGIYNGATLTLDNSTLEANSAQTGGGVYNTSTLSLTDATIAANTSQSTGGGLLTVSGATSLQDTILSKNVAPSGSPDCGGSIVSNGYNLVGIASGCTGFGAPGDQINVGAHLGPLQDNGGPTLTMAPLPGSPAIDAVAPSSCSLTTDQRAVASRRADRQRLLRCRRRRGAGGRSGDQHAHNHPNHHSNADQYPNTHQHPNQYTDADTGCRAWG